MHQERTMLANGHRYRIWYVVSPIDGQWQVTFGNDTSPFVYATREEAQVVARSAARLHWEDHQDPSGALLMLPGEDRQVIATYGRIAPPTRARAAVG